MIGGVDVQVRVAGTRRKPSAKDVAAMLDIGIGVVEHLTVVIHEDEWDYDVEVELLFSSEDVRYYAQSVRVSMRHLADDDEGDAGGKPREVTSVILRQVKVAEAVRVAASGGLFVKLDRDDPAFSLQDWYGTTGEQNWVDEIGEQITSRGPTEQNLRLVAQSYMIAQISGEPPAKAVERIYSLPARTASNWIARAKSAGFIRKPKVTWRASRAFDEALHARGDVPDFLL